MDSTTKQDKPLPPMPQNFWDENRARFNAESTAIDKNDLSKRCEHYFYRVDGQNIGCKKCLNGWRDNGVLQIRNGQALKLT